MTYEYRAVNPSGLSLNGTLEASSTDDAKRQVADMGLELVSLQLVMVRRPRNPETAPAPIAARAVSPPPTVEDSPRYELDPVWLKRAAVAALVLLCATGFWILVARHRALASHPPPGSVQVTVRGTLQLKGKKDYQGKISMEFKFPNSVKKKVQIGPNGSWQAQLTVDAKEVPRYFSVTFRKKGYKTRTVKGLSLKPAGEVLEGNVPFLRLEKKKKSSKPAPKS